MPLSLKPTSAGDRCLRGQLLFSEHFENHCWLFSDSHCCFWDSMSVPCLCFHCTFCSEDALLSVLLGRRFILVLTNSAPFFPATASITHSPFSFGTLVRSSLDRWLSVLTKPFRSLLLPLTPLNCQVAPSLKRSLASLHRCHILFKAHGWLWALDLHVWELQAVLPHAATQLCCALSLYHSHNPTAHTLPLPSLVLTFCSCFHSKILTPLSSLFALHYIWPLKKDQQRAVPKLPLTLLYNHSFSYVTLVWSICWLNNKLALNWCLKTIKAIILTTFMGQGF